MNISSAVVTSVTPVQSFYANKTVFLTGATGVLGELFVEKLLRCNVKCLYILLRAKRQKTPQQRIVELCNTVVYRQLRAQDPHFEQRIRIVEGDLSRPQLGIGGADLATLAATVDIIIHSAANVRFNHPLHTIALQNVRATRDLLAMATGFRSLLAFVHVSTAYSNSHRMNHDTAERFYAPPIEPDALIRLAEHFEADEAAAEREMWPLTARLIAPWPNTYSFTKAVGEDLVRRSVGKLPVIMVRPSVVIATFEDPLPGYCTNYFGLNTVMLMVGTGLLRTMLVKENTTANIVCADFVINGAMSCAWYHATNKPKDPPIYTINNCSKNTTWGNMTRQCLNAYITFPFAKTAWMARLNFTTFPIVAKYCSLVYHVIPAICLDLICCITGKRQRFLKIYRKLSMFTESLQFFYNTVWKFEASNLRDVQTEMTPTDRLLFPCGVDLDFNTYGKEYGMGLRQYMLKDTPDTIPAAKRRYAWLVVAHYVVLFVYYGILAGFYYILLKRVASL